MRKTLLVAVICGTMFTACQNGSSSVDNVSFDSSIVTNTKQVNDTNVAVPAAAIQNNMQLLPNGTNPAVQQPVAVNPAPVVTAAGMNPPHGQPGHRCDIAVGAPLNSPVAKTTATTTTTPPVTTQSVSINPNPVKTAPGMNPPHGQPGHRCDIAVGAPLNSPAAKTTTTPANTQTPVTVPVTAAADTAGKQ